MARTLGTHNHHCPAPSPDHDDDDDDNDDNDDYDDINDNFDSHAFVNSKVREIKKIIMFRTRLCWIKSWSFNYMVGLWTNLALWRSR